MGIRLNMCIGYGLDIAGLDKAGLKAIWEADGATFDAKAMKEFLDACADNRELAFASEMWHVKRLTSAIRLEKLVTYDGEFGFKDKLLLHPIGTNWTRRDDDIDYQFLMATHEDRNDALTSSWREIKGAIYPYIGLVRAKEDEPYGFETFWESCYLDKEEFKDAIARPPFHLWFVLRALKLAPPERTTELFLNLRPTAYRYWS